MIPTWCTFATGLVLILLLSHLSTIWCLTKKIFGLFCLIFPRFIIFFSFFRLFGKVTVCQIMKGDDAASKWIVGWVISQVSIFMELFQALIVGACGANLADLHHFTAAHGQLIGKAAFVPKLEQAHIGADVAGGEPVVDGDQFKKGIEVSDVIHVVVSFSGKTLREKDSETVVDPVG